MPLSFNPRVFHYLLTVHLLLLSTAVVATVATAFGITYNPSIPKLPPPDYVSSTIQSLHFPVVRLLNPTPISIRAFAYTNISLLLSVPNHLVPSFATNRSAASVWLYSHVLPYHPRTHFSLISVGSDVISSSYDDVTIDPSTIILPAMRNLYLSLRDFGIRTISVSTTFSFINVMTTSFPPSSAEFQEPINSLIIRPLLQFLDETNSSFLINIYPYNVYKINSEIPIGYALFQENPYNFRDDIITGVRYGNLFDMMVDAVIAAMAVSGHENIPVIVTETGWPSNGNNEAETEANRNYAEMYLKGLVMHLRSGMGTPLRKEGVAGAYIYQLFDDFDPKKNGYSNASRSMHGGQNWGIMYNNMTMKYKIDFSHSERVLRNHKELVEMVLGLLLLVTGVLLLI
ncbi:Glycosyl hydrolase superfamily protein [Forsythia ovata]|uniref:Glycosyl hydrolase superfamily protein n=1 Tax=Forsythia ovata TaxID=205694 RepID=A0ABD1X137_9LAMI